MQSPEVVVIKKKLGGRGARPCNWDKILRDTIVSYESRKKMGWGGNECDVVEYIPQAQPGHHGHSSKAQAHQPINPLLLRHGR